MSAKPKKRFRGFMAVGIVCAALIFLFIFYARPLLQYVWKLFPAVERVSFISNMVKAKEAAPQEGMSSRQAAGERQKEAVPVVVHRVSISDFEDTLPAMGTIKGVREIELRFEVNGVIDAINFKEADLIKKGDIIAVLNQQDAILKLEYSQSKRKTAQTQMLTARKKLEIHQKLYEVGSIIKAKLEEVALEYENAKSQVTSAEKEVDFAKQELQKAYLISPIDGVFGTKDAESGEFVTSNTKIGTVVDISSVFAEVGIIERDMQKISLGQEATVTVDSWPDTEFKGTIEGVLPIIEGKSRTITCRIKIDNESGQLLPGMFSRAMIFVFGQSGAIVVPNTCLRDTNNDGAFDSVFTVDAGNVAHLTNVEVGYLTTDSVVIAHGLEEDELVVTDARGELKDGSSVEILETQEALGAGGQPTEEMGQERELIIN